MNEFFSPERMALGIPFFVVASVCAIVLAALLLRYLRRRRLFELYHEERMAAINKGMEVPSLPEMLLSESGRRRPLRPGETLLKGLVWAFAGLGVVLVLNSMSPREVALGFIPMGVGVAYLIYYFAEGRKLPATSSDNVEPPPPVPAAAQP